MLDAGDWNSRDSAFATPPDVGAMADGPEGQPDATLPVLDVQPAPQPDATSAVLDTQSDVAVIVPDVQPDSQPDTALVVLDTQPDGQPDAPVSNNTLTVDKSSVDLASHGQHLDGGVGRPIALGDSGTATVVVTNNGDLASGALAVVAGPSVSTSGCTGALAPGAACTLAITATPAALGQFSSTVSIWATPGAVTPISITVNATVVPRPSIASFVASPSAIASGESSILTAIFSNGTGDVDHGVGAVTSGVGTNTGPIRVATTYTLTVTNEFGDSAVAQVMVDTPSCITQVVANGYACGSATSCAACKDMNGNSREDACKKGIDCFAKAGAECSSSCQQDCLNQSGDTPGQACVTALRAAACSGSGC